MAKKKLKRKATVPKNKRRYQKRILLVSLVFIFLFLPAVTLLTFNLLYLDRIYPGIYIAGISLGGLKKDDAVNILKTDFFPPAKITVGNSVIPTDTINLNYDLISTVNRAYAYDRSGNKLVNIGSKIFTFKRHLDLPLVYLFDQEKLNQYLDGLSLEIYVRPVEPSIKAVNGQVVITNGSTGLELDRNITMKAINDSLTSGKESKIPLSTKIVGISLSRQEVQNTLDRANKLYAGKLTVRFEDYEFNYSKAGILKFVDPKGGFNNETVKTTVNSLAKDIEREPQNPVFVFNEGVVKEFLPAVDGVKIDKDSLEITLLESLAKLEAGGLTEITIEIPVTRTAPENRTEDVNNLGIRELIGKGVSYFRGSISSRIHNISLASSKFNGILVAPGETLSFNKILGDVSKFTGYQEAYIIQDGKTILGDGGGVCQVSTTLFRAVLNAGLPVLERRAHAYRVNYYEQGSPPGLDATVFDPTTNFKFKNNTQNHLLIQTKVDKSNLKLTFEIYGTSDGRKAEISKPVVSNPVPPPEDLYTDDPTLPAGTVKQIDWKAWGAKVTFKYKVTRSEEILIEKIFVSNYQPWQAKYLRGTGSAI